MFARSLTLLLALAASALASSPADAVAAAHADALKVPPDDRPYTRYLWDSGPPKGAADRRAALKLHWNKLSRETEIAEVAPVGASVYRVNLQDIGADPAVWERAGDVDHVFKAEEETRADLTLRTWWPGGRWTDGKEYKRGEFKLEAKRGQRVRLHDAGPGGPDAKLVNELRAMLFSEAPILEARWFLAQSARQVDWNGKRNGFGYYDFLGLKSRKDYFELIGLNEAEAVKRQKEVRAVVEESGVSPLPRQVVRLQAINGGAWVTLDTNTQAKGNVATRRLKRGELKHQAEEWYGPLNNDLDATYASSDAGAQQDFAPADTHGFGDTSALNEGKDVRIHVNLACARCHRGDILKPLADYVRRTFEAGAGPVQGSKNRKEYLELRRQYFSDIDEKLAGDRARFARAYRRATVTPDYPDGLAADQAVRAYARAFHQYVDDRVTAEDAARELGVRPEAFVASLRRLASPPPAGVGRLDPPLAAYIGKRPGSLSRSSWEQVYGLARRIARGQIPKEDDQ